MGRTRRDRGATTTTGYAVLGLLTIKPWTTYELAKQVQRSLGWFWPRAERQLYDEPKRLVDAGFATGTEEHTGRRPRTMYAITPAGRRALRSWLGTPPAAPIFESEAMVKVFFADVGNLAQLTATLDAIEAGARARIDVLGAMIEASRSGPYEFASRLPVNALALRFQLEHEAMQVRWAAWARDHIASWNSPSDPGTWDWYDAVRQVKV